MSIRANVGRSGEHNAVQRPEEPDLIREAVAFVDATDSPLAAEDVVIDVVLVDAVAKAGLKQYAGWTMAIMEGERAVVSVLPFKANARRKR